MNSWWFVERFHFSNTKMVLDGFSTFYTRNGLLDLDGSAVSYAWVNFWLTLIRIGNFGFARVRVLIDIAQV